MRTEQFHYLIKISKTRSINSASEQLHLSQQSLSRSIQSLEKELNMTLLERTKKGVSLTPAGTKLVDLFQRFLTDLNDLNQEFNPSSKESAPPLEGNLLIGHTNTLSFSNLIHGIQRFKTQYPYIDLYTVEKSLISTIRDLEQQQIDLGLISLTNRSKINKQILGESFDELVFTPLLTDQLIVVLNTDHPLAKHKSLSLKQLINQPLVFLQSGTEKDLSHNWLHNILEESGTPKYSLMTNNINVYLNGIINNIGIGFLTQSFLENTSYLASEKIVALPIEDKFQVQLGYIQHKTTSLNPLNHLFIECLTEFCAEQDSFN